MESFRIRHTIPAAANANAPKSVVQSDAILYGAAPVPRCCSDHPAYEQNRNRNPSCFTDSSCQCRHGIDPALLLLIVIASCLLVLGLLSQRLDANEFSLHLFYRNRLVRAFLGASNGIQINGYCDRRASPFTKFAMDDDMEIGSLVPRARDPHPTAALCDGNYNGPYPIWCATLNLTQNTRLAAQQRKGDSFIYSPLYCGWDYTGDNPKTPEAPDRDPRPGVSPVGNLSRYAYRRNRVSDDPASKGLEPYGGDGGRVFPRHRNGGIRRGHLPQLGLPLQTVCRGAAGDFQCSHRLLDGKSPPPRRLEKIRARRPCYCSIELCGFANDKSKYVYISDGGHFENLGIYELIRRRVKFIIACRCRCRSRI